MKLAVVQPYFFPYIGYFQLIDAVDVVVLYDRFGFSKGGWVHRNRLLVVGRQPTFISAPVRRRPRPHTIADAILVDDPPWRSTLLKTLRQNYRHSAFFEEIYGVVESVLSLDTNSLAELNKHGILEIASLLGLHTEIRTGASTFDDLEAKLAGTDGPFDEIFPHLSVEGTDRKTVRLLELCRDLGADTYVNAAGGRSLYEHRHFERNGVSLAFLDGGTIVYPQRSAEFHANLSIIDVLMSCGPSATAEYVARYTLG